jgi:hypothetical protein
LETLLDELFDSSLQRTGPCLLPRPLGFVVPHAGLIYSGTVAASAYRTLREAKPERVFILGFCHRGDKPGVSIPDVAGFETPLGEVEVDQTVARELASCDHFVLTAESRVCDHSVEIQLPLLQRAVPGTPAIPLYVGPLNEAARIEAARVLAQHVRPGDVMLASSDLTHYGRSFGYQPFPPDANVGRRLSDLDSSVIDAAGSVDAGLFLETLRELGSTVCGYHPIALLLQTLSFMAGEDLFQHTLDYQTSADITGDVKHSVSYGALGYFRPDSFCLDQESQEALLASARATLRHLRETGERRPIRPPDGIPSLARRATAFVSLHQGRDLYGCIGTRTAKTPLAELIPKLTLSAALDDPRFSHRVVPAGLDIEVSLLTPMRRIRDWRLFRIGRDGAYLEYGARGELLLPQVARDGAFTEARFMEALCQKAGLRPSAYRDPQARLSVFRAQVFGCRDEEGAEDQQAGSR